MAVEDDDVDKRLYDVLRKYDEDNRQNDIELRKSALSIAVGSIQLTVPMTIAQGNQVVEVARIFETYLKG